VKRFRGGLVFEAHRRGNHSTLGWRVMKKKKDLDRLGLARALLALAAPLLVLLVLLEG